MQIILYTLLAIVVVASTILLAILIVARRSRKVEPQTNEKAEEAKRLELKHCHETLLAQQQAEAERQQVENEEAKQQAETVRKAEESKQLEAKQRQESLLVQKQTETDRQQIEDKKTKEEQHQEEIAKQQEEENRKAEEAKRLELKQRQQALLAQKEIEAKRQQIEEEKAKEKQRQKEIAEQQEEKNRKTEEVKRLERQHALLAQKEIEAKRQEIEDEKSKEKQRRKEIAEEQEEKNRKAEEAKRLELKRRQEAILAQQQEAEAERKNREACEVPQNESDPEDLDSLHSSEGKAFRPSVRTSERTNRRKVGPSKKTNAHVEPQSRTRHPQKKTLQMSLHLKFGRGFGQGCTFSLLPQRRVGGGESVEVVSPIGKETWYAHCDDSFGLVAPMHLEDLLGKGGRWAEDGAEGSSWLFTFRDIWVLAPGKLISGFVSATRLVLNQKSHLLFKASIAKEIYENLELSGCVGFLEYKEQGVPEGWVLLQNVEPTQAVEHDNTLEIMNVLRPISEVEIELSGGIRLRRDDYLAGRPPNIRLVGSEENLVVEIDGMQAKFDAQGIYTAENWDAKGEHQVFCGGKTKSYRICEGLTQWDGKSKRQFTFGAREKQIEICGPTVTAVDADDIQIAGLKNRTLIGAKAGEITNANTPYDINTPEFIVDVGFVVVFALPENPLRCDKASNSILFQAPLSPSLENGNKLEKENVIRWCRKILDASRKGLPLQPDNEIIQKTWREYRAIARNLLRRMR